MAFKIEMSPLFSIGSWKSVDERTNPNDPYFIPQPPYPNETYEEIIVNSSRNGEKAVVFRLIHSLSFTEAGMIEIARTKHPEKVLKCGDVYYFADGYIDDSEYGDHLMPYPQIYRIRQT